MNGKGERHVTRVQRSSGGGWQVWCESCGTVGPRRGWFEDARASAVDHAQPPASLRSLG
jgi:hypothetical protein